MISKIIFWFFLFIMAYSYLGYGFLLLVLATIKKMFCPVQKNTEEVYEPELTLFIAAYNEKRFVHSKMQNIMALQYPKDKLRILWVTDGSDDGTPDELSQYNNITVLHKNERRGKIGAINRGMRYVTTPIVVFSDCNTMLSPDALKEIVSFFKNPSVGCVAGEKRIIHKNKDVAVNIGEGFYWIYESMLKSLESKVYSVIGAAGELFAIRTGLFDQTEPDTLLDDFMISMRIAQKGYMIKYAPKAYAMERASLNISEELKRKKRIAAGSLQALLRLKALLNPLCYGILSFQYISHKVLRWTLIPFAFPFLLVANILLLRYDAFLLYQCTLILQILFYIFVMVGKLFEKTQTTCKILFVPYYVFIMNYSLISGFFRYIRGHQSVNWERAERG